MHFCRRVVHMMHRSSQTWAFVDSLFVSCLICGLFVSLHPFLWSRNAGKALEADQKSSCLWLVEKGVLIPGEKKTGGFQGWCGKCGKSNGWSPLKSGSLGNMASGRWPTRKLPGLISPTEVWLHCGLMSQCASPTRTLHRHEGEREVSMVSRYGFKGSTPF